MTVVEPDLLGSATEVAVTVTAPTVLGAVKSPEEETLPAAAFQVTAVLKFPVPWTMLQHWTF